MRPQHILVPAAVSLVLAAAAPVAGSKPAEPTDKPAEPPATDAELLEFLGSVDSGADQVAADDGSWIDYLSQTDISKVAQNSDPVSRARAKQVGNGTPPAAPGDKKDE